MCIKDTTVGAGYVCQDTTVRAGYVHQGHYSKGSLCASGTLQ